MNVDGISAQQQKVSVSGKHCDLTSEFHKREGISKTSE